MTKDLAIFRSPAIQEHTKFRFFETFNGLPDECSQGFHITGRQQMSLPIKEYKRIEVSN